MLQSACVGCCFVFRMIDRRGLLICAGECEMDMQCRTVLLQG